MGHDLAVLSLQHPNPERDHEGRQSSRFLVVVMLLRAQAVYLAILAALAGFPTYAGNQEGIPVVGRMPELPLVLLILGSAGAFALGLTRYSETFVVAVYEGALVVTWLLFSAVDRPAAGQVPMFRDPASLLAMVALPVAALVATYWPFILARGRLPPDPALQQLYREEAAPPAPTPVYVAAPQDLAAPLPVVGGVVAPDPVATAAPMRGATTAVVTADPASTPSTAGAIWRETPPEVPVNLEWLKLSGLDRLRSGLDGVFPPPSFGRHTGLHSVAYGPGEATVSMPVTDWLRSSAGVITGGVMAYMADSPLGSAVFTELPRGDVITTSEMSIHFLRPAGPAARALVGKAKLVHIGRSYAFSEVNILDDSDRLLAYATARNLIIHVDVPDSPFIPPPKQQLPEGYLDPYLRSATGKVLPPEVWTELSGIEIQRRLLHGELPPSPLSELFGIRRVDIGDGRATTVAPATEWLASPARRLYGGALALLADNALGAAVQTTTPAGTAIAPLDLKLQFVRPLKPDGRDISTRATVVHRGRTMAVASAEVIGPEGKVAALATSTWLVVPDFSWATDRWVSTDELQVAEEDG
ncbi:MAG: hypothetical protein QOE92_2012 [Chloroflexota bacterium]|nr:hypothetical protein [Chloroflexota bacterium]